MLTIIIVEDEQFIRKGLLYSINWEELNCVIVAEAEDGREGLDKIIEYKPDVVITDIKMPNMDGLTMVDLASERHKFQTLILTSYMDFEYAQQAIKFKVADYLIKPIDEEKIKEAIQKIDKEVEREKEIRILMQNKELLDLSAEFIENETTYCVEICIQKIKENYNNKISIEMIADELSLSSSYLSRKFKEETKHTFHDYLSAYRIRQAIQLLSTGIYRVGEISDMTGFSDYKHFSNVFKRYTDLSPTFFYKKIMNKELGNENKERSDG